MSMQPIFLLPLSTTVWGEIDEQIRSWAALKKDTFTRIFIRLIPPSFPTKCFLYCSKICSLLMPSLSPSTLVMVASHLVCFGLRKTRLRCSLDPPRMIVLFRISVTTSSSDVVLITETLSPWISKFCRQCTLVGTGSSQLYLLPIPILTRCSMHGCTFATTGSTSSAGKVSRVMYKVSCGATLGTLISPSR